MSSPVYRNLIRVLEKWPIDSSKKGRDLGELVRRRIASSFPLGESSRINVEEWTKIVAHLDSISSNQALQKFPRKLKSSATGLSVVECKEVVSTDFLNKLKEQESKGFFKA